MANEWAVTTERLVSSAGVIEEKTAKYNSEWAKLYTELQSLKSSQWQGIASDTFNAKLEAYRNDFEEMALKIAATPEESTDPESKEGETI